MGAGEDWLPIYRDSGMHNIYLGDEAVVGRAALLAWPAGTRRACARRYNRITKYGYTVPFHDPSHLDPDAVRGADRADEPQPAGRARARASP